MKLKTYTLLSLIYISLISLFFYLENDSYYTFKAYNYELDLPISIWLIIPTLILFMASLLHMIFFSIYSYIERYKDNNERKRILSVLNSLILNKKSQIPFSGHEFYLVQKFINQAKLINIPNINTDDENIKKSISLVQDINDEKFRKDIDKFGLDKDNALNIKNCSNRMKSERGFANTVLKKYENYNQETIKEAILILVENEEEKDLKDTFDKIEIDKDMAFAILKKQIILNISLKDTIFILKKSSFNRDDFIKIAKVWIELYSPDKIMDLFEELSSKIDKSLDAYICVLLELELIDKAKELIDSFEESKYHKQFKLYLEIKKHEISCDILDFITV
jgi:hypothetical protein